jgi:hypothetical protein
MGQSVRYITELSRVREVSLLGTADLAYWTEYLRGEALTPAVWDGHAQVLVVAAAMRYLGFQFTEISFSVLVEPPSPQERRDAAFLIHAFNSCRLFAFCERTLFSTPHVYAGCRASTNPVSMEIVTHRKPVFRAAMGVFPTGTGREPVREEETGWEGPIFLPAHRHEGRGRRFFARLWGRTRTYSFLSGTDTVVVRRDGSEIFRALADSGFAGREWIIREDATHARSRTYARDDPPASSRD